MIDYLSINRCYDYYFKIVILVKENQHSTTNDLLELVTPSKTPNIRLRIALVLPDLGRAWRSMFKAFDNITSFNGFRCNLDLFSISHVCTIIITLKFQLIRER